MYCFTELKRSILLRRGGNIQEMRMKTYREHFYREKFSLIFLFNGGDSKYFMYKYLEISPTYTLKSALLLFLEAPFE